MRRLSRFVPLLMLCLLLAGCGGGGRDEEIDPVALLTEAATNIRAASTFRLDVSQTGVEYFINILWEGEIETSVSFRRAQVQYVSPDQMQGFVRVIFQGIPVEVGIYSLADRQWVKFPFIDWFEAPFAYGFNPQTLIAEDTGFQAALNAVRELTYEGVVTLEDGTSAYHLKGTADGPAVTALLVNLIEETGAVGVEIFVHRTQRYPVRLIITQPTVESEAGTGERSWTVDVYDVDAPAALDVPSDAEAAPDATSETTSEPAEEPTPDSTAETTPGA
ncbi:MAG: LppX_LprAFG lipoprotein [bacterium]|nr:LppX_LprAFG lipoprotein [bacterium]